MSHPKIAAIREIGMEAPSRTQLAMRIKIKTDKRGKRALWVGTNRDDHNYLDKLGRYFDAAGAPEAGEVRLVTFVHDDWCSVFRGGRCDCNPDMRVETEAEFLKRAKT